MTGEIELKRRRVEAEFLDPNQELRPTKTAVEIRWDPLTGHTSRILPERGLMPPGETDPGTLAEGTSASCPFCPERIESQTPAWPSRIVPDGRLRRGRAVLFPNLFPYGSYSSVSVYAPELHVLRLKDMSPELMADNLAAQIDFARAVTDADPRADWISINANHLPPSGSSILHPHLQGLVDQEPTTAQLLLANVPEGRFTRYLETERSLEERYLGSVGRIEWVASFAPLGPAEIRGLVPGVASPVQLEDRDVRDLGRALAAVLSVYAGLGYESFNMAIYGAPPETTGYPLNVRVIARSGLRPFYRSDATYLERLHWEAAVDIRPEDVAALAKETLASI